MNLLTNPEKIMMYNDLIRNNPRLTKVLEKSNAFPLGNLNVIITNPTKREYSQIYDWCGSENMQTLMHAICSFENKRLLFPRKVERYSVYAQDTRKNKLIRDLSDCFEPLDLIFKPITILKPYMNINVDDSFDTNFFVLAQQIYMSENIGSKNPFVLQEKGLEIKIYLLDNSVSLYGKFDCKSV